MKFRLNYSYRLAIIFYASLSFQNNCYCLGYEKSQ